VGQLAVVGEEQHTLDVGVQPADRVDALAHLARQQVVTTGRPWGSRMVVTTPGGLWSSRYCADSGAGTALPVDGDAIERRSASVPGSRSRRR